MVNSGAAVRKRERSTEEIINRSQQNINEREIERTIDDTINQIDRQNSNPGNSQQQGGERRNNDDTSTSPPGDSNADDDE